MAGRLDAEKAIRRWRGELGLPQKLLALRAGVKPPTVSKIKREPGWTASEAVYKRICDVVSAELATRIGFMPMRVLSLCHGTKVQLTPAVEAAIVKSVKSAFSQRPNGSVVLPKGIKGALLQVGERTSGMFLVVVSAITDAETRLAVAHELEHLRMELLDGLRSSFTPPRSTF